MTKQKLESMLKTFTALFITTLIFNKATAQLHVVKPNGNVGIGIEQPVKKLHVKGIARITPEDGKAAVIQIGADREQNGLAYVDLYPTKGGPQVGRFLSNEAGVTTFTHFGAGDYTLQTYNPNSKTIFGYRYPHETIPNYFPMWQSIAISPTSSLKSTNIGIGTGSPTARLHVNGDAVKPNGGSWKAPSDARLKNILGNYEKGIDAVLKLNPVLYKYNGKGGISDTETEYVGLIAQEFRKVAPKAISKYSYTEEIFQEEDMTFKKGATEEYLAIDPSEIIYMLVNAAKEQQSVIEGQKVELETLKETVAKLAEKGVSTSGASEISVLLEGKGTEKALLTQNTPNPFTSSTRIEYFIPTDSRNARMSFRDMTGKEIKRVDITNDGIGTIELTAKDLAAGIYSYVLYVNGSIAASKKMILKK